MRPPVSAVCPHFFTLAEMVNEMAAGLLFCYSQKEIRIMSKEDTSENPNIDREKQRAEAEKIYREKEKFRGGSHIDNKNSRSPADKSNPASEVPNLDKRKKREQDVDANNEDGPVSERK